MSEEGSRSLQGESESKSRDAHEESPRGGSDLEERTRPRPEVTTTSSDQLGVRDVCFLLDMDGGGGLCFEAVAASEAARRDGSGD